jgi:hypothetical protein
MQPLRQPDGVLTIFCAFVVLRRGLRASPTPGDAPLISEHSDIARSTLGFGGKGEG